MKLMKYFLVNIRENEDRIRLGLQEKLDALVKRELYTKGFSMVVFANYNNRLVARVCYKSVQNPVDEHPCGHTIRIFQGFNEER